MVKKTKERKYSIFLIVLGVLSIVLGLVGFVKVMWGYLGFVLLVTLATIWVFKLVQSQKVDVPALVLGIVSVILFAFNGLLFDFGNNINPQTELHYTLIPCEGAVLGGDLAGYRQTEICRETCEQNGQEYFNKHCGDYLACSCKEE